MKQMTQRIKAIQKLRDKGMTLQQIADMLGISKQRVHQLLKVRGLLRKPREEDITKLTKINSGARDRYRELIRIRDNHTCQLCDWKWKEGERRLDIHHLDEEITGKIDTQKELPVSYDYQYPERCITLCHRCHLRLHHRILNKIKYDK